MRRVFSGLLLLVSVTLHTLSFRTAESRTPTHGDILARVYPD